MGTIVVKIGGAKGIAYPQIVKDIAMLIQKEHQFVLVHGGKYKLEEISTQMGNPPQWLTSVSGYTSRYTNQETMDQFIMAYAGYMNKMIVSLFQKEGVNAVGLCGLDGKTVQAARKQIKIIENGKKKLVRDDFTGKIQSIDTTLMNALIQNHFLPVICPPAIGLESEALNIDGDRMAAAIAESIKAETIIYLSNVPGLLRDKDDSTSLITKIEKETVDQFMQFAQGTMQKKVMGAIEGIEKGIKKIIFADGRIENPVQNALNGKGTVIC